MNHIEDRIVIIQIEKFLDLLKKQYEEKHFMKVKLESSEPINNEPRWKKYPDEKPLIDQQCIVMSKGSGSIAHKAFYDSGYFRSLEGSIGFPLLVTHWMSISEEPE